MKSISGYNILEKLEETRSSVIYKAARDNEPQVIIKVFNTKISSQTDIVRFKQEYEIIKTLILCCRT